VGTRHAVCLLKFHQMKNNSLILCLQLVISVLINSCDQNPFHSDKESHRSANKPPETYLFLFVSPDTTTTPDSLQGPGIDTTASKQILHWWGEDIDGEVVGYFYQWDYQQKAVYTKSEYDTFYVPIRSSYDEFTFKVWAVDNDSLIDPTPAVQMFPVYNTFPEIDFKVNSNPNMMGENPDVINYTFPTRTFYWDVYDADGGHSGWRRSDGGKESPPA